MANTSLQSLRVSGSSHIPGGHYDEVHGSGSIRIDGNLTVNRLKTSGSIRGQGALKTQELSTSGSTRIEGSVEVVEGRCSGSFRVDGGLRVLGEIVLSGSSRISGAIAGEEVRGSGALRVGDEVALEKLRWSGSVHCPGLVSADVIELHIQGISEVGELAGAQIQIQRGSFATLTRWLSFLGTHGHLTVSEVSGDEVLLEATDAAIVRGERVVIGAGCRIDRVEYRESLTVHPDSMVGQSIQVD